MGRWGCERAAEGGPRAGSSATPLVAGLRAPEPRRARLPQLRSVAPGGSGSTASPRAWPNACPIWPVRCLIWVDLGPPGPLRCGAIAPIPGRRASHGARLVSRSDRLQEPAEFCGAGRCWLLRSLSWGCRTKVGSLEDLAGPETGPGGANEQSDTRAQNSRTDIRYAGGDSIWKNTLGGPGKRRPNPENLSLYRLRKWNSAPAANK
jgi:hypothetical protein